jgi:hypothetical protein
MSLAALSHKYIGRFTLPAQTPSGSFSAINSALTSTTYADGTSRSAGTDVAWSCTLAASTAAAILSPASSSLGQKIICAGGAAGSPTMLTPDAYSSTKFFIGLAKNAGSYVSWSNANPFSAGQFSGYYGGPGPAAAATSYVHIYETIDTIWIVHETAAGSLYYTVGGAILDSESSNSSCSESDGKLYGIMTSGGSAAEIAHQGAGTSGLLYHTTANAQAHCAIFSPGTSTMLAMERQNVNYNVTNSSTFKNLAGEFVRQPIFFEKDGGGTWYGRFREVLAFPNSLSNTKFTLSSVVNGYILGSSTTATSNTILLKA